MKHKIGSTIGATLALTLLPLYGTSTALAAETTVPQFESITWKSMPDNRPDLSVYVPELDSYGNPPDGSGSAFRGVTKDGKPGSTYLYDESYTVGKDGRKILRGSKTATEGDSIYVRLTEKDQLPADENLFAYCGKTSKDLGTYQKIESTPIYQRNYFSLKVPAEVLTDGPGQCFITNAGDAKDADKPMPGHTTTHVMRFANRGGDLPGQSKDWTERGKFDSNKEKPWTPETLNWTYEASDKTYVSFDGTYLQKWDDPVWSLRYHYTDITTNQAKSVEVVSPEQVVNYTKQTAEEVDPAHGWQYFDGNVDIKEYAKKSAGCTGYVAIALNGKSLWDENLIAERQAATGETYPLAAEHMKLFKRDITFPGCPATKVTVDPNNGDPTYESGAIIGEAFGDLLPTAPTRPNHEFLGWVDANGNPVTKDTTVTENLTLKARWKTPATELQPGKTHTPITVDPNNGDDPYTLDAIIGDAIGDLLPTAPTRPNHEFLGWVDANGNPVTKDTTVTENLTLKARWKTPATELQPGSTTAPTSSPATSKDPAAGAPAEQKAPDHRFDRAPSSAITATGSPAVPPAVAPKAATGSRLATTGVALAPIMTLAAVLIAAGGFIVAYSRRKES